MFGLYIPQLFEPDLIARLALLAALAVILVHYLRQRHGTVLAVLFVGGGWILASTSDIMCSVSFDLGRLGDAYRGCNQVNLPDWFWALHWYFAVGRGGVVSLLGIVGGAVLLAVSGYIRDRLLQEDKEQCIAGLHDDKSDDTMQRD